MNDCTNLIRIKVTYYVYHFSLHLDYGLIRKTMEWIKQRHQMYLVYTYTRSHDTRDTIHKIHTNFTSISNVWNIMLCVCGCLVYISIQSNHWHCLAPIICMLINWHWDDGFYRNGDDDDDADDDPFGAKCSCMAFTKYVTYQFTWFYCHIRYAIIDNILKQAH